MTNPAVNDDEGPLSYHGQFGLKDIPALKEYIKEHDLELVVIDSLRRIHGNNENESDQMAFVFDPLRQLARDTGCTILLIHHTRKSEGNSFTDPFRGSTEITAAVDWLLLLKEQGGNLVLEGVGKDGRLEPLHVERMENLRHVVRGSAQVPGRKSLATEIEDLLAMHGPQTTKELAELLNRNEGTISNAVTKLKNAGRIASVEKVPGKGGGNKWQWIPQT